MKDYTMIEYSYPTTGINQSDLANESYFISMFTLINNNFTNHLYTSYCIMTHEVTSEFNLTDLTGHLSVQVFLILPHCNTKRLYSCFLLFSIYYDLLLNDVCRIWKTAVLCEIEDKSLMTI